MKGSGKRWGSSRKTLKEEADDKQDSRSAVLLLRCTISLRSLSTMPMMMMLLGQEGDSASEGAGKGLEGESQ